MPTGLIDRSSANRRPARDSVTARAEARGSLLICCAVALLLAGCEGSSREPSAADAWNARNERHVSQFGNFGLPRGIGTVENCSLQIPVVSPDGKELLYLRTDHDYLSPMTLLGSSDPRDTPPDGTLAIWIRPVTGTMPGHRLSSRRWAHSPVWSDSGRAVVYVVNEPPVSYVVYHLLDTGEEVTLGVPEAINCLPRFDGNEGSVLYCSGETAAGPLRVYRQSVDGGEPVALTPEGMDCVYPIASDAAGNVLCARLSGDCLNWARCSLSGFTDLPSECGFAQRPNLLQTWAGIPAPLSPDGRSFLFYDTQQERIGAYHAVDNKVVMHRQNSIAACWLTSEAIALATPECAFIVNTVTGMSLQLFNGSWIPVRYVPARRRLLLLGREKARRFSIKEVVFTPR